MGNGELMNGERKRSNREGERERAIFKCGILKCEKHVERVQHELRRNVACSNAFFFFVFYVHLTSVKNHDCSELITC